MINPTWNVPPENMNIPNKQVHVWRAWLTQPMAAIQRMAEFLSDDEKERAGRFHFERDRHKFIIGRGALRLILARYLGARPEQLQFSYGPQGKPALAKIEQQSRAALKFNLAHSRNLALYAFTCGQYLGIDVEYIRRLDDMAQMAERFFSPRENAAFRALPEEDRPTGFFSCWTRKEAYLKACGDGLTRPLDQFDVTLQPGEPARLLAVHNAPAEAARWRLEAFQPAPNYIAALAVEDKASPLAYWQFSSLTAQLPRPNAVTQS